MYVLQQLACYPDGLLMLFIVRDDHHDPDHHDQHCKFSRPSDRRWENSTDGGTPSGQANIVSPL